MTESVTVNDAATSTPEVDLALIGAIVGGILCCLILLGVIIALLIRLRRKKRVEPVPLPTNWTEMASARSERVSIGPSPPERKESNYGGIGPIYTNADILDGGINYARVPEAASINYAPSGLADDPNSVTYGKLLPDPNRDLDRGSVVYGVAPDESQFGTVPRRSL